MAATRPITAVLAALGALPTGCARFSEETTVHTLAVPGAAPLLRETRVVGAELEAQWEQRAAAVEVALFERRACRTVTRVPARREEKTVRRPDAMIFWEYGLAALALGVSALAFARPTAFASSTYDSQTGLYTRDPKTGYALGGVFAAVGTGFLIGGIVDSVRARPRTRVLDTTVLQEAPVEPCEPPVGPASGRAIALVVGARTIAGTTDDAGRVRFVLPPDLLPADAELVPASLRVPAARDLSISLVPPARAAAAPHTGVVRGGAP